MTMKGLCFSCFLLAICVLAAFTFVSCEPEKGPDREEYSIGSRGPAGGWIFYDCDADNDSGNADGLVSSECGWRYLEAAPADITVGSSREFIYGFYMKSATGEKLYVNGTTFYNKDDCTGVKIGTGKSNTEKLIAVMGSSAYYRNYVSYKYESTSLYAAKLCDEYSVNGYDDWFLPSINELSEMYMALKCNGEADYCLSNLGKTHAVTSTEESRASFAKSYYFSSSEYNDSSAHIQHFSNGNRHSDSRGFKYYVRAVRAF